jgi:deazaflavin-dependent oxidoreductase (nitroreductase family)
LSDVARESTETLRKEKFAYLTTVGRKTGKTHTIELWFAFANGRIFLSHEGDYTDWMKNIAHHGRVRLRIGKLSLDADGNILKEGDSRELGKRALYEKYYGPAPKSTIDDWFELSTIMELIPVKYSF